MSTAIAATVIVVWVLTWMTSGRTLWWHLGRVCLWLDVATEAALYAFKIAARVWIEETGRRWNERWEES